MVTAKILASLLLIAAVGVVDAERGRVVGSAAAASDPIPVSETYARPDPSPTAVRAAVLTALAARLRADLSDPTVEVSLDSLTLGRPNGSILAADGTGQVSLGAGGRLPLHFDADWDSAGARLERLDYQVAPAAQTRRAAAAHADHPALRAGLRKAIASRLETALRAEFANQPSRFELLGVERVESGRRRMVVAGSGITHFDGEGAAFTRFTASLDKFDGRVLHVDYELLEDAAESDIASR